MERHHLKKHATDSSSRLATKDDFNALTNSVIALAQSVTDYVYEMGEHDEDAYDSRGEIFEEDVDYIARGDDCHYIPMLGDEIANYYNPPPFQNQQEREVDHFIGQYFNNAHSNLNFNSRQDEEQEEPTLVQLMSQMMATQAQQGKDIQLLTSELQQERAARRILETQLAQQTSNSYENPEKSPSQPEVRLADVIAILLKSGEVFEGPMIKERASTEVVEEDVQLKHVKEEVEEQETPYVAPSAYVPPMSFPHRKIKVLVETIDGDKVIDNCKLTFDEREVLSNKHAKNSDVVGDNLTEVIKKSFHEGPEILICNTRLKDESTMSLPGH